MKTKKRVIGKQFGPEPHQYDPFEGITDREFEAEVLKAFDATKQRQKAISNCQRSCSSGPEPGRNAKASRIRR